MGRVAEVEVQAECAASQLAQLSAEVEALAALDSAGGSDAEEGTGGSEGGGDERPQLHRLLSRLRAVSAPAAALDSGPQLGSAPAQGGS